MKKIAIVIADLDLGGGQRVAINLAKALAKNNQVSIVIFQDDKIHYQTPGELINLNCPEASSLLGKVFTVFKRAKKLKAHIKQAKYDHVYGFMETANFPTAMVCKDAALSVHCNPRELSFSESFLLRMTYHRAKNVIAVADDVATILRDDYGLKNVSRIYNPIDVAEVQSQVDEPFQHPKPFIVALGRFHEVKRYDLLLDAYSNSRMKQDCDLIIVGDGELRDSLENQVNALQLYGKVYFVGTQNNPFPYLASATDCPTGPREIVRHNENGLLVENENTDAFSKAMDTLFYDDLLR